MIMKTYNKYFHHFEEAMRTLEWAGVHCGTTCDLALQFILSIWHPLIFQSLLDSSPLMTTQDYLTIVPCMICCQW